MNADLAELPPRVAVGDRWRRRSTAIEVEVSDVNADGFGRVGLREVNGGHRYRVKPLDLGRNYDRLTE